MSDGMSAKRRSRVEMEDLDAKIRPLYEAGAGCRAIGVSLGENPVQVYKRVQAMGIGRTTDETYEARQVVPVIPLPFNSKMADDRLRAAAIGEAVSWFLRRGYNPSIPVEPARYDVVTESEDGLKRIQVKTTTARDGNRWVVGIARQEYAKGSAGNANGRRVRIAYRPGEVDFFFVVAGDGTKYLIPFEATGGARSITLDRKYASYRIE